MLASILVLARKEVNSKLKIPKTVENDVEDHSATFFGTAAIFSIKHSLLGVPDFF